MLSSLGSFLFFFNDTATTEIYTLSLHDALPIYWYNLSAIERAKYQKAGEDYEKANALRPEIVCDRFFASISKEVRSEEHTSELQSQSNLVCRLLLEKKKKKANDDIFSNTINIIY